MSIKFKRVIPFILVGFIAFMGFLLVMILGAYFWGGGFSSYRIASEGMSPTLQIGDRVLAQNFTISNGEIQYDALKRGDILFYNYQDRIFVQRVIGIPGDEVTVIQNQGVSVNGHFLNSFHPDEKVQSCTMSAPKNLCEPIKIPSKFYYFMGDNWNHSFDSRYIGLVHQDKLKALLIFRLWPPERWGSL
ncbi:MAG: signal peptidase I [Cyanobacteria bacterium]|nr:signal peptidase I [Cyanobacteriota bacterium]